MRLIAKKGTHATQFPAMRFLREADEPRLLQKKIEEHWTP